MTTKQELEAQIRNLEEKLVDKEFERFAQVARLTERIIKQENTINQLVNVLEESYGKPLRLADDNGLTLII